MKKIYHALMLLIGCLLASCEHKELCFDHSPAMEVEVVFDWKNSPEAHPESMRLYLFPKEGGEPLLYEFPNKTGGIIKVQPGEYKALCYNSDTETIGFRNIESMETFEAYALKGILALGGSLAPRAEGTEKERIALQPEMLYSDRNADIIIKSDVEKQQIVLYPKKVICHYDVEIRNATNLRHISMDGISGSLSSLAGGFHLGENHLTSELVTMPFELKTTGSTTLKGDFYTFGQHASNPQPHKLVVYAIMSDGNKRYYTFDVTDQVDNAPDPYNVHIILDRLPLPQPIPGEGGFQPTVDEWEETVPIDISM